MPIPSYSYRRGAGFSAKAASFGGTRGRSDYMLARGATARTAYVAGKRSAMMNSASARATPRKQGAFVRQLKALVAGKRKDASDVNRSTAVQVATTISCLTSTTDFATAASGTGLLDMDGDEALLNSVTISQELKNTCQVRLDSSTDFDSIVRTIVVWFYKPLLVASAAGTLPPITEVLVADNVESLYVPDTQNAGRFTILYDKNINIGTNTLAVAATGAYPRISGQNHKIHTFTVKIDKRCHFRVAGVSGTPSGHYDSDVTQGQVDRGLLVMYNVVDISATGPNVTNITRLNYTG